MRNYPEEQQWDPEPGSGGGGGGGSFPGPQRPHQPPDQAQKRDKDKTTEQWENDKLPKQET
jgi:hypothetical protein